MNKKCRLFKGIYLDPSSKGYQLLQDNKTKELENLVKECAKKAETLEKPA